MGDYRRYIGSRRGGSNRLSGFRSEADCRKVKVWFQNRRTKFKRVKAEEDDKHSTSHKDHAADSDSSDDVISCDVDDYSSPGSPSSKKMKTTHHVNRWRAETNQMS
ncbi:hypothetical protein LSH36_593g00015 [Paralvinella palmiformis]|uniref:Homeobox domain-containing protein n=1 Tax=Paralvinella palmiformis TaxID=53620 RepID=A0AAD9MXJ0_9ANNE|nr:hypothetical protein LSH36_593g00015 [Paralvinella palmiformis]